MDKDYEWVRDNSLVNRKAAVRILNNIGYHITYMNLAKLDFRGKGPVQTTLNGDLFYRVSDLRAWLEKRLEMPIRQAIEVGLLTVPPELGQLNWDADHTPVRRVG